MATIRIEISVKIGTVDPLIWNPFSCLILEATALS